MINKNFSFYNKQAIIYSRGELCKDSEELTKSELFKEVVKRFLDYLYEDNSSFLDMFGDIRKSEICEVVISLLQKLTFKTKDRVIKENPEFKEFFEDVYTLHQFVENFYNYWRNYERFFVYYSEKSHIYDKAHKSFNQTVEKLNEIVREVYRNICDNITGSSPSIYRQIPAGSQVGLIVTKQKFLCPKGPYDKLKGVGFIRQVLIEPPLILDPPMNKRKGQFIRINSNPLDNISIDKKDWLCYPAKVGDLVIYTFFHNKMIGLGTSLANLFELASDEDLKKKPDAVYVYGVSKDSVEKFGSTVFYDDEKNNMMVGVVPGDDEFAYFGYLKKMLLTLHNIIMMKRKRLPVHGAMVKLSLKDGNSANIVIMGDSGTGKSESLEAFRVLGEKHIRDMTIIFDDMGSLELINGQIKAYGTEVGAFVRLDDLHPGFAFGNVDRSIIMSPQKINARVVLPITTLKEVLEGYPVDFFMYANNYEHVDKAHPIYDEFKSIDGAFKVFKKGVRMAKGTTTEKGLVSSYFANIFGPVQYKELHEALAKDYFKALFDSGVKIAQLRTRLGILGFETKGPEAAAKALFEMIRK
ncbi:MAG: phosphoenolpyruvate carboxykinase [Nanoarchaeota archaeon]|nr:phosphoenolpyruvate carboxykinase [DPANN group archaeon]MBL7116468.1 phosphoenolpyruvate carboxykinase [Nanoarchaeota archaeon]